MAQLDRRERPQPSGGGLSTVYDRDFMTHSWQTSGRVPMRGPASPAQTHRAEHLRVRIVDLERELASLRELLNLKDRQIVNAQKQNERLHREIDANYNVLSQVRGDIRILEDISRVDPAVTHRISGALQRRLSEIQMRTDIMSVLKMTESYAEKLRHAYPALTEAELQIASFLRLGYSTAAIAATCCISERTVENHRLRIRRKMSLPKHESLAKYLQLLDDHSLKQQGENE